MKDTDYKFCPPPLVLISHFFDFWFLGFGKISHLQSFSHILEVAVAKNVKGNDWFSNQSRLSFIIQVLVLVIQLMNLKTLWAQLVEFKMIILITLAM